MNFSYFIFSFLHFSPFCFYLAIQEQAVDREHERDFFQQEIQKLEEQLRNPQKPQNASEQRNHEVTEEAQLSARGPGPNKDAYFLEHNTVVATNTELRVIRQNNRAGRITCAASKMIPNSGSVKQTKEGE